MTNCIMRIFRCHKINEVIARGEKFFKGFSLFACRKKDYFSESKNITYIIHGTAVKVAESHIVTVF